MGQSTGFSRHPGCEAAPKLLLGAPHRPHKQGQSQDTPAPQQLQADWPYTNREAPSRMWEGCSTLICWRSAAGGRRNRKGSDQQFPSQGTPSTPHHPRAFLLRQWLAAPQSPLATSKTSTSSSPPSTQPRHSAVALHLAGPDCTCLTAQQEGLQYSRTWGMD